MEPNYKKALEWFRGQPTTVTADSPTEFYYLNTLPLEPHYVLVDPIVGNYIINKFKEKFIPETDNQKTANDKLEQIT